MHEAMKTSIETGWHFGSILPLVLIAGVAAIIAGFKTINEWVQKL